KNERGTHVGANRKMPSPASSAARAAAVALSPEIVFIKDSFLPRKLRKKWRSRPGHTCPVNAACGGSGAKSFYSTAGGKEQVGGGRFRDQASLERLRAETSRKLKAVHTVHTVHAGQGAKAVQNSTRRPKSGQAR